MKCFGYEKKKRKKILCKIYLLDDTQIIHEIQDTSRGQDVMDVVCKHLNLLETAYFGLRFVDSSGQPRWLNLTRRAIHQVEGTHPLNLYFCVKFYAVDPCKLAEEITRYQFFLQLKQDIFQSRLPVPPELAAELFAYTVQSELGDYDASQHTSGYISEFRFMPNQSHELEMRVSELHKRLLGQVPAAAELAFLERVKWLDLYGADLHPVLGEDCTEYFIALVPSGILVLRGKSKVGHYYWPRVVKFYRKGRYFMLKVAEKHDEEKTYGFELPSDLASKHLQTCCRDQQSFFSLASGSQQSGAAGCEPSNRIIGLSQRFRNSISNRRAICSRSSANLTPDSEIRRSPPTVVRVPSRRYQRRSGVQQQYSSEGNKKQENSLKVQQDFPQVITDGLALHPQMHNRSSVMGLDTKSLIWDKSEHRSPFEVPSPYSVYTEARSRRRSSSRSRAGHSDNESQGSRSSRRSRHSHHSSSSHRSNCRHHNNSENESEAATSTHSRRRRRHRKSRHRSHRTDSSEQLVDSHQQWIQIQQMKQSNISSVSRPQEARIIPNESLKVRNIGLGLHQEPGIRKTGIMTQEIRKMIEETKQDAGGSDLQFTQLSSDQHMIRIRYSPTTGKVKCKVSKDVVPPDAADEMPIDKTDPIYSNLPTRCSDKKVTGFEGVNWQSAGSRAPLCVEDIELALNSHLRSNEMATEL